MQSTIISLHYLPSLNELKTDGQKIFTSKTWHPALHFRQDGSENIDFSLQSSHFMLKMSGSIFHPKPEKYAKKLFIIIHSLHNILYPEENEILKLLIPSTCKLSSWRQSSSFPRVCGTSKNQTKPLGLNHVLTFNVSFHFSFTRVRFRF